MDFSTFIKGFLFFLIGVATLLLILSLQSQKGKGWEKLLFWIFSLFPPLALLYLYLHPSANPPLPRDTPSLSPQLLRGKILYEQRGCAICHEGKGGKRVGPPLTGIVGKEVEWEGGEKGIVTVEYLKESIENPTRKIVKGYPPLMPSYQGAFTKEEMEDLLTYLLYIGKDTSP